MPGQVYPYGHQDWDQPDAGLYSGRRGLRLKPWQFVEGLNLELMGASLVKRGGTTQVGTVVASMAGSGGVSYLDDFYYSAAAGLVAYSNGAIWYKTTADWIDMTVGTWANTYQTYSAKFAGSTYLVNGVQAPRYFPWGVAPVDAAWTVFAGVVPHWVAGPLYQRLFYGDVAAQEKVYFTLDGDPQTTSSVSFLRIPDDRMGQNTRYGILCGDDIVCFCADWVCNATGASPLSFRTERMPRGAAIVSPRTAVDMGGVMVFMTTKGPALYDRSPGGLVQLDARGNVDWSVIDYSTPRSVWAMRYFNEWHLYFPMRGYQADPVGSVTITAARLVGPSSILTAARAFSSASIVGGAGVAAGGVSHRIRWDMDTGRFWGPETAPWLSGVWSQYDNGEKQNMYLGSATSNGVVAKGDQRDRYTDCTGTVSGGLAAAQPYDAVWRSGAVGGDAFEEQIVEAVNLILGGRRTGKVRVRVYWDGDDAENGPSESVSCESLGPVDVSQGVGRAVGARAFRQGVWRRWVPKAARNESAFGFVPQLEMHDGGQQAPLRFDGYQALTSQATPRGGR